MENLNFQMKKDWILIKIWFSRMYKMTIKFQFKINSSLYTRITSKVKLRNLNVSKV